MGEGGRGEGGERKKGSPEHPDELALDRTSAGTELYGGIRFRVALIAPNGRNRGLRAGGSLSVHWQASCAPVTQSETRPREIVDGLRRDQLHRICAYSHILP